MGIIDKREISFDARSLISVVKASLTQAAAIGLPAIEPCAAFFDAANQQVAFSYANEAHERRIAGERLGALLVTYCVKARIPLPRHSEKTMRVKTDAIIIMCTTRYNDPPQTR